MKFISKISFVKHSQKTLLWSSRILKMF